MLYPHDVARRAARLGATALLLALASVPAQAQSALWYEVALGGAGARLTCGICTPDRDVGASISGAVGAYAGKRVRVGLEYSRWSYRNDGVREQSQGLGLVAHLVPNPARGLYLLGGAGWTGYAAGDFTYGAPRITVGVGYDLPAFGRWVAGNVVTTDFAAFGALRNGSVTVVEEVGLSAVRFAVQLRRR